MAVASVASLAACSSGVSPPPTDEPTAPASPDPTLSAEPTASPSASVVSTTSMSPSSTPAFEDRAECENEDLGYEVEYPADWWANDRIEPDDERLTPIAACQYFAPSAVDLQPNAGLPMGLSIWFRIDESGRVAGEGDETLERNETTIDGHESLVIEVIPQPQPGFVPEDSRTYLYAISLADDRALVASTDDILQDRASYEASKGVLDAMMQTIEIDD